MTIRVDIGKEFSRYPGGRTSHFGPKSGEAFRERFLIPHLTGGHHVEVLLDSAVGYGSSFLDEAFAGLVRSGFTASRLRELLTLTSDDDALLEEIWGYVDDEDRRRSSN